MNRRHLPQLVRVIALVALALPVVIGAATIKPVHPASLTAGLSAPLFIAVLADNYAAGQEQAFDLDVENFFKHGLLVDDYYKNRAERYSHRVNLNRRRPVRRPCTTSRSTPASATAPSPVAPMPRQDQQVLTG